MRKNASCFVTNGGRKRHVGDSIKSKTLRLLSIMTHLMPSPPLRQDAHLVLPNLCEPHRESQFCGTVRSLIRKSQSSTLQGSALEADDDQNSIPSLLLILLADPRRVGREPSKRYMLMEFLTINPPTESVHLPQGPRGNLPRENLLILHRRPHRRIVYSQAHWQRIRHRGSSREAVG